MLSFEMLMEIFQMNATLNENAYEFEFYVSDLAKP